MINEEFTSPRPSLQGEGADVNRKCLLQSKGFQPHRGVLVVETACRIMLTAPKGRNPLEIE